MNASQGEDIIRLFTMAGTSSLNLNNSDPSYVPNYYWNIKIRQIDCVDSKDKDLVAPEGCLQYFTSMVGTLESFNWRMDLTPYPVSLDYSICIKRQGNQVGAFCGVQLTTSTVGDGFKMNSNSAIGGDNYGRYCYDFEANGSNLISQDYIEVLQGFTVTGGATQTTIPTNRICGTYDGTNILFPGLTSKVFHSIK